jgi:small subunit ribosomal protein S7
MPRRNRPPKREIQPDVRYDSVTVARFINKVMRDGKRSLATRIVYDAMDALEERTGRNSLEVFEQAVENAMPVLEVRPRRVGGATYQVPMEVPSFRRMSLGLRWLVESARQRPGKSMAQKLAAELMDAAQGEGATVRRKENVHRMAEANRAFAHFRW